MQGYLTGHLRAQSDTVEYNRGSREVGCDEAIGILYLQGTQVVENSFNQTWVGALQLQFYLAQLDLH